MKTVLIALLLIASVAACEVPQSLLDKIDGAALNGPARTVIGNNKLVELTVSDTGVAYIYAIKDWTAHELENQTEFNELEEQSEEKIEKEINLIITTDSCTLEAIDAGADSLAAYEEGKITVQANTVGSKFRLGITKMVLEVVGWFS